MQGFLQNLVPVSLERVDTCQTTFFSGKGTSAPFRDVSESRLVEQVKADDNITGISGRLCVSRLHKESKDQDTLRQVTMNTSTLLHSGHCENLQDLKHAIL